MARALMVDSDIELPEDDDELVRLEKAAIRRFRATAASVERSNVVVARVDRATISQSNVAVVAARSLALDEVKSVVLAAPVVRGEVHTLVDMRSALALGFGFALGRAVLRLFRRR